jgi:hypothetical protein
MEDSLRVLIGWLFPPVIYSKETGKDLKRVFGTLETSPYMTIACHSVKYDNVRLPYLTMQELQ